MTVDSVPSSTTLLLKRFIDVVAGTAILLAAMPLMIGVAAAIKIDDGGPVFFRQSRLGLHGRVFQLVKFRSMVVNASELPGGDRVTKGDGRITRVGVFLRRFSLDELPQIWQVLKGEMSLVGPRPALVRDLNRYSPRERRRLCVRPGITGLAQVNGRTGLPWRERLELDACYVRDLSLLLDLKIAFQTPAALLRSTGIYPQGDPWNPTAKMPGRSGGD